MQRFIVTLAALVALGLTLQAAETKAETKPVTGTGEAKVDKAPDRTVDKYVGKTTDKCKCDEPRFWVRPEFLMMWSKDGPVHDVITLRTTDGGDPLLGNPAAHVVQKNPGQDYGMQLGGRLDFGLWVDEARRWGFELSGFALEEKEARWTHIYSGVGERVAFSAYDAGEDFWLIADHTGPGTVAITSNSQLWGVGASGVVNLRRSEKLKLDATFGVRHLDLSEDFGIETLEFDGLEEWWQKDSFDTHNQFYGAKLGAKFSYTAWERLLLSIEPSVSLGADHESLKIRGGTRVGNRSGPSGFFAMTTNIGDYSETKFAVVPEIKLGLGCKITKNLSFNASYNFLYMSNVVRPGEQVSRRHNFALDPWGFGTGVPTNPASTPRDPAPRFKTSDYWAQGLGLSFKVTW
jgi:hypothetical protein